VSEILYPSIRPSGIGLQGLQERVELLDGQVIMASAPGRGTRLEAIVPLDAAAEDKGAQ
jgi:signal transduction histidine kinase